MEAQHVAHAHGHIGITGKVEIDLEGKGQDPHPYHKDAAVRRKDGRDLRPQGAGLIGQQDLFSQAHHETADPQGKTLKAFGPGVQLRGNVLVADNGAGNELGEHGHIGSEAYDIVLDRSLAPVYVDGVGHGLERIKGDPNGKGQAQERDPASGEAVDGTDEKVRIFKDHQKGQIDERGGGYRHPGGFPVSAL